MLDKVMCCCCFSSDALFAVVIVVFIPANNRFFVIDSVLVSLFLISLSVLFFSLFCYTARASIPLCIYMQRIYMSCSPIQIL